MSMSVGSGEEDPSFAFTRGPKGKSTEKIKSSARRICIYVIQMICFRPSRSGFRALRLSLDPYSLEHHKTRRQGDDILLYTLNRLHNLPFTNPPRSMRDNGPTDPYRLISPPPLNTCTGYLLAQRECDPSKQQKNQRKYE